MAVKSQSRKLFKTNFEKENSIFNEKEKNEKDKEETTEKEEKDFDTRYSRNKMKQKQLEAKLSNSTIFVNSTIKRDALEYALKQEGFSYSPEQIILAIGISESGNYKVSELLEKIKKGEISDEIVFQTDSYMEKGMNMLESTKGKDFKQMTIAEKKAKNIIKIYDKYYANWQEENNKKREAQQDRDI